MYLLPQVFPLPFSSDFRQNTVLFHHSEYCFRIVMDTLILQPQVHPTVAIGLAASILLLTKHVCQRGILFGLSLSLYIVVVAASRYFKDLTHGSYRVFLSVSIDNFVLILWPHILPVSKRKSRNSSFSIFSRLFSYLYSCKVLAGFRPRCFGMPFTDFFRSRFNNS